MGCCDAAHPILHNQLEAQTVFKGVISFAESNESPPPLPPRGAVLRGRLRVTRDPSPFPPCLDKFSFFFK